MVRIKKATRTKKTRVPGNTFSTLTRNLFSALNLSPPHKTIRRKVVTAPIPEVPLGTRKAKMKVVQSIVKKMNANVKKQQNKTLRKQLKNNIDDLTMALSKL